MRGLVNLLKAGKGGDRCIMGVYLHRPPPRLVDILQGGGFWCGRGLCKVFFTVYMKSFSFFFYFVFNVVCFSGNCVGRMSGKEARVSRVMETVSTDWYWEPVRII